MGPAGVIVINTLEFTNNNNAVTLNLFADDSGSGIYQMRFSNTSAPLEWSAWKDYDITEPGWDMADQAYGGDSTQGIKTVFVQFIDYAGNTTQAVDTIYLDAQTPTNPNSTVTASVSSDWTKNPNPTFTWSGASDPAPSSGLAGYYVYFGTDQNAQPKMATDNSNLALVDNGGTNVYNESVTEYSVASPLVSGQTYYLKIQTYDNAYNEAPETYLESQNLFIYKFDDTAPEAPEYIDVTPPGITTIDSYDFTWPAALDNPTPTNSGICRYEYMRENGTDTWTTNGTLLTKTNILKYRSGANRFDVRAVDCAGNTSLTVKATYYFSDPAALVPQNLQVDTSASSGGTINNFKFSWDAVPGATRYYIASNSNPTESSTSFSVASLPIDTNIAIGEGTAHLKVLASGNVELGPYPSATQTGPNDFRVVAVDSGGNANWATPAIRSYSVNTAAPAAPSSLTITDASSRSASMYALTVMWPELASPTPDFDGYVVEKSEDGGAIFTPVATVKTNIYSEAWWNRR